MTIGFDLFRVPKAEAAGEPGVGITIYVDETDIGGTWLSWSETVELHAWLTKLVELEDGRSPAAMTELAPNQIWTPAIAKRAKAREVVRLQTDADGNPSVVWTPFWRNCGRTDISTMRARSFRAWIRKMKATCEVVHDE